MPDYGLVADRGNRTTVMPSRPRSRGAPVATTMAFSARCSALSLSITSASLLGVIGCSLSLLGLAGFGGFALLALALALLGLGNLPLGCLPGCGGCAPRCRYPCAASLAMNGSGGILASEATRGRNGRLHPKLAENEPKYTRRSAATPFVCQAAPGLLQRDDNIATVISLLKHRHCFGFEPVQHLFRMDGTGCGGPGDATTSAGLSSFYGSLTKDGLGPQIIGPLRPATP